MPRVVSLAPGCVTPPPLRIPTRATRPAAASAGGQPAEGGAAGMLPVAPCPHRGAIVGYASFMPPARVVL